MIYTYLEDYDIMCYIVKCLFTYWTVTFRFKILLSPSQVESQILKNKKFVEISVLLTEVTVTKNLYKSTYK